MADYTILTIEEVPDVSGDYPGEMRFFADHLGTEQIAFTFRRMAPKTGGKGSYGHSHRTQEELLFLISGTLELKVGDEVKEIGPGTVVRFAPSAVRSVWNDRDEDAELIIVSKRLEGGSMDDEVELTHDFWPQ